MEKESRNKIIFIILVITITILLFITYLTLPIHITFGIAGCITLIYTIVTFNSENEDCKKELIRNTIISILLFGLFIGVSIDQYNKYNQNFEGTFVFEHKIDVDNTYEGELIFLITSDQINSTSGLWMPIQDQIVLPQSNHLLYHKLTDLRFDFTYTIELKSTLAISNYTIYFYGDNDFIDTENTFLHEQFVDGYYNYTTKYNNVMMELFKHDPINTTFYMGTEERFDIIEFRIIASINKTYYAEHGIEDLYYGDSWLNISINPFMLNDTWGKTTSYSGSLTEIFDSQFGGMWVMAFSLMGVFIIIFIIGFITQRVEILKKWLVISLSISVMMLLFYISTFKNLEWLNIAKNGLKSIDYFEWFSYLYQLLDFLGIIYIVFLWAISIGVMHLLMYFLSNMVGMFTMGADIKTMMRRR